MPSPSASPNSQHTAQLQPSCYTSPRHDAESHHQASLIHENLSTSLLHSSITPRTAAQELLQVVIMACVCVCVLCVCVCVCVCVWCVFYARWQHAKTSCLDPFCLFLCVIPYRREEILYRREAHSVYSQKKNLFGFKEK